MDERTAEESLNASEILHLALQKVDGIIACNNISTEVSTTTSTTSAKTDISLVVETSNGICNNGDNVQHLNTTSLDSLLLTKSFTPLHQNNVNSVEQYVNGNRKIARNQDKLNRLLQELQDFSLQEEQQQQQQQQQHLYHSQVSLQHQTQQHHQDSSAFNQMDSSQLSASGSATPGTGQHPLSSSSAAAATASADVSTPPGVTKNSAGAPLTGQQTAEVNYHHRASPVNDIGHQENGHHYHQHHHSPHQQQHHDHQNERIIHLESMTNILRSQLMNTEELFKKSLLSKKSLENANCDLMTVIDKLKLDVTHAENLRKLAEEHNARTEQENQVLKNKMLERETEISSLRLTMAKIVRSTGYSLSDNELALLSGKTIASDFIKNKLMTPTSTPHHQPTPTRKDAAQTPIKSSMSRPTGAFYSEPASRRDSYSSTLCGGSRYNSAQPSPAGTPPPLVRHSQRADAHASQSTANQLPRSSSAENMKMNGGADMAAGKFAGDADGETYIGSPSVVRNASIYSTLPHSSRKARRYRDAQQLCDTRGVSVDCDRRPVHGNERYFNQNFLGRQHSRSLFDDLNLHGLSGPPTPTMGGQMKSSVHYIGDFRSQDTIIDHDGVDREDEVSIKGCSNSLIDRTFFWLRRNKRAISAPELAKDDEIVMQSMNAANQSPFRPLVSYPDRSSQKGFKKFFSKKRSTSSVSGLSEPFARGGLRATSGPRLGSVVNAERKFQKINTPFSQWETALVADWFALIGLGMYVSECKRWVRSGEHLMRAEPSEVERELRMKNPLHRKKLRLAVAAMNDDEGQLPKNAAKLDYLWVARWLDDIGLPQYKDAFIDARIDGRMLHYLTVEDLLFLKINSLMHFASIRAGIRILRENNYNSTCLIRRSTDGESASQKKYSLDQVSLWSSHRVMEWLRSIDLSEYAPNLRGSGVHGGLILYENAFNSDLFATLLSIPSSKTLLRKHIFTKFHELIGEELRATKDEHQQALHYVPMTLSAKVKANKKGLSSLMRKKKCDFELMEYVCPMTSVDTPTSRSRGNSVSKTVSSVSSDCSSSAASKISSDARFTPDQEPLSKSETDILEKAG